MLYMLKNLKLIFCCSIFFLWGLIVTINTVQNTDSCVTEKNKNENKIYYRTANFINPNLVILIISAPGNLERRNVIRQTWLNIDNKPKNLSYVHYFVVGSRGLSTDEMLHLSGEQSRYNDLLILPIEDHYSKLTQKILHSFIWLREQINYGLEFNYLLKCDDDTFVRLHALTKELKDLSSKIKTRNYKVDKDIQSIHIHKNDEVRDKDVEVYWGYFDGNSRVQKVGKWQETNWILCDHYLPYAQGGGYILTKGLVKFIALNAENLATFNSEDVSVGAWLAPVTNIMRIHDIRFDTEWKSRGCLNHHLVFHKISLGDMKKMYRNVKATDKPCLEEKVTRKSYIYQWDSSPSKCCAKHKPAVKTTFSTSLKKKDQISAPLKNKE